MAVNTFRRYIWLLDYLERVGYATFEEIQKAWSRSSVNDSGEELPLRTFRNHITAISDQFGIDIEFHKGLGYQIANPEDLNESRASRWLLSSLSMYNTLAECQGMKDKILFDDVPSQKYVSLIVSAIRDGNAISFMYQSHFECDAHLVEVEPYCLKLFRQRWYMLGRRAEEGDLRTYAIERMSDVDITGHAYTIPNDFDGEEYFRNYYGIRADGQPEVIRLKAIALEAKYLRSLPVHHSQREIETGEDYAIFELFLSPTWDFKQDLLSRADQIEVLQPQSLRAWMEEMTGKMNMIYR